MRKPKLGGIKVKRLNIQHVRWFFTIIIIILAILQLHGMFTSLIVVVPWIYRVFTDSCVTKLYIISSPSVELAQRDCLPFR